MKRSETPEDLRNARHDYITTRWTQLSDLSLSWGGEAIKYLLVVNTAAMGGTLGFIGAMPHIRPFVWPKIVLLLFAGGIVLVGAYHAIRYHRIEWLFQYWRQSGADYVSDKIEWNELLDRDEKRSKRMILVLVLLAYGSLLCFLAGLLIAGANFHQITDPPLKDIAHERTKTPAAPPAAASSTQARTSSPPGAATIQRPEAAKDGSTEGSAARPGPAPARVET